MSRRSKRNRRTTVKAANAKQRSFNVAAGGLRYALSSNQPGSWASDHRREAERCTDWNYIAIKAIALQAMQASVNVFQDSGPTGSIRKSHRQNERRRWRSDPSLRLKNRQYWDALKSLYGQEDSQTKPLPDDALIVKLMSSPNPHQSGATFRYERVVQLQLTGSCLVWNVPNQNGKTVERYVIPTAVATPVAPSPDLPRGGYRVEPHSSRWRNFDDDGFVETGGYFAAIGRTIPLEQIQVTRWPHPVYKDDGLSPISAGSRFVDISDQVNQARWAQMKNGFEPSLVINLGDDVDVSEEELERMVAKIEQKYCGSANNRKVIVLAGGKEIASLGTSPKDMDYATGFTQSRDSVMAIHGVPPVMAGIQEAGAYAAYYASLRQGVSLTVQPILDLLAEDDTRWFASPRPDPLVKGIEIQEYEDGTTVEIEAPPIDDVESLEKQLVNDINAGAITVDELRSLRGRPPLGGERGQRIAGPQQAQQQQIQQSDPSSGMTFPVPGLGQK